MTPSAPIGWLGAGEPRPVYGHDATGLRSGGLVLLGDTIAPLGEWADALGVRRNTVGARMRHGWTALDALAGEREYLEDVPARRFVLEHPGGATLAEVGAHFGVTRERVRQVEATCLRKLRRACARLGIDARAWLYAIQQRTDQWGPERVGEAIGHLRGPSIQERVLALLSDGERWDTKTIAARIQARSTSTHSALERMVAEGLLAKCRGGRRVFYELAVAEESAA